MEVLGWSSGWVIHPTRPKNMTALADTAGTMLPPSCCTRLTPGPPPPPPKMSTALGDITGITLPSAFMHVDYEPGSAYYSFSGGVTLTMVTIFLLGILATKAEPALNVLGETVETLSSGKFTKKMLIWAVCFGVAIGMCAGE